MHPQSTVVVGDSHSPIRQYSFDLRFPSTLPSSAETEIPSGPLPQLPAHDDLDSCYPSPHTHQAHLTSLIPEPPVEKKTSSRQAALFRPPCRSRLPEQLCASRFRRGEKGQPTRGILVSHLIPSPHGVSRWRPFAMCWGKQRLGFHGSLASGRRQSRNQRTCIETLAASSDGHGLRHLNTKYFTVPHRQTLLTLSTTPNYTIRVCGLTTPHHDCPLRLVPQLGHHCHCRLWFSTLWL